MSEGPRRSRAYLGTESVERHWQLAREESVWLTEEAKKASNASGLLVLEARLDSLHYRYHWTPLHHLSSTLLTSWGVLDEHGPQLLNLVQEMRPSREFILLFVEQTLDAPSYTVFQVELGRLVDNVVIHQPDPREAEVLLERIHLLN